MDNKTLPIQKRTETGKNANRRLREAGLIPAVVYSHGEAAPVQFSRTDFFQLFKGHISESIIFNLHYSDGTDSEDRMAFIKDYQQDPVKDDIMHVDFYQITTGEVIQTNIEIEFVGTPAGIKLGGVFEKYERDLAIEALPRELPEKITIDVSGLELGDSIHAGDITFDNESVRLLSSPETVIAAVHEPKAVTEEDEEELDVDEAVEEAVEE